MLHRPAVGPAALAALITAAGATTVVAPPSTTDIIVVGAGISGLAAALEAAHAGASVDVFDLSSVPGGHAVLSTGAVSLVGTPLQEKKNIQDSPELATRDFIQRGGDADPQWVRAYTSRSREELYNWLTRMGVEFEAVLRPPGNTVPRLHMTKGKGLALVMPLYRECLRHENISFKWNTKVERLSVERGRVVGVETRQLRTGRAGRYRARSTIIATGGFQSNLELVLKYWPEQLPRPDRLLAGAGYHADGSGHDLARQAGGGTERLDHQWNYVLGLPDPRDPAGVRGLAAVNFKSIWVNGDGKRFVQELGDPKLLVDTLLKQKPATYWSIFDKNGRNGFSVTLAGWERFDEIDRLLLNDPKLVKSAPTLDELAVLIGVPPENLRQTIDRYNVLADEGVDKDFAAFGPKTTPKPGRIEASPFYAVQFFPITRKSMGGVRVDTSCRVLDKAHRPIQGLYAVGEVTGFAGINGRAALEGTFLGPGMFMGRVAARAVVADLRLPRKAVAPRTLSIPPQSAPSSGESCLTCHPIARDIERSRSGFWHFERSHRLVLQREYECVRCHTELTPFDQARHRIERVALTETCVACHGPR